MSDETPHVGDVAFLNVPPGYIAVYTGKGTYVVYDFEGDKVDIEAHGMWSDVSLDVSGDGYIDFAYTIDWKAVESKPDPSKILRELTSHDSW